MFKKLRTYLFRGLLILLPAGATFLLLWKMYQLLDKLILIHIYRLFKTIGIPAFPGLELFTLCLIIVLVGFVGGNFLGRMLVDLSNFIINKIPIIRVIYMAIKQILEAFFLENKKAFSKVALIEYPRKGLYSLVFITSQTRGTISEQIDKDLWSVFLPTTPNPTSGFLLFVPKEDAIILDIPIDQAAKLIISAGVIDEKQLRTTRTISITELKSWYKSLFVKH